MAASPRTRHAMPDRTAPGTGNQPERILQARCGPKTCGRCQPCGPLLPAAPQALLLSSARDDCKRGGHRAAAARPRGGHTARLKLFQAGPLSPERRTTAMVGRSQAAPVGHRPYQPPPPMGYTQDTGLTQGVGQQWLSLPSTDVPPKGVAPCRPVAHATHPPPHPTISPPAPPLPPATPHTPWSPP